METYFVRSRGKLAGPFGLDVLQQLVRRGKVSRFDQVSQDKASWRPAGELAELFASGAVRSSSAAAGGGASPQPVRHPSTFESHDEGRPAPGPAAADPQAAGSAFYYAQNGAAVGPLSLAILQTLTTNGTLRGDDPVWVEGSDIATPARQVPMLASLFSGRQADAGVSSAWRTDLPDSVRTIQFRAKVTYLIVAALVLIFTMMPIAIVRGRAVWWWNTDGWTVAASIYTILSAVALLIVAPLAAGLARPVVALSLIAVQFVAGLAVTLVLAVQQNADGPAVLGIVALWGAILFPVLLASVSRLRPTLADGGPVAMRALQVTLGSLLVLASIAGVILLCIAAENWTARPNTTTAIAYVCAWVGVLANLAGGVLAIIVGKPQFDAGLNLAGRICLGVAAGAFTAAGVVQLIGVSQSWGELNLDARGNELIGVIGYAVLRIVVFLAASIFWLSAAFRELLAWTFRASAVR